MLVLRTSLSRFHMLGFLVSILASMDVINLQLHGYHFKLNILIFAILGLMFLSVSGALLLKKHFIFVTLFVGVSCLSMVLSGEYFAGLLYVTYTFIVMYLVVYVVFFISRKDPVKFSAGFLFGLIFQVFVSAFLVLVGVDERAHFLYYEPSYFAYALIPLFASFFYRVLNSSYRRGGVFYILFFSVLIFLAFSKSANGVLTLVATFIAVYVLYFSMADRKAKARILGRSLLFFLVSLLAFFALALYLKNYDGSDLLLMSLKKSIYSDNFFEYAWERAGNRGNRILLAWDVFVDNWMFGVGPGNYINYINNIRHDLFGVSEWLSPKGQPAVNMYLEIAATTGVVGFFAFSLVIFNLARTSFRHCVVNGGGVFFFSVVSFLLVINFESSFLRMYFWAWVGLVYSYGSLYYVSKGGSCLKNDVGSRVIDYPLGK